MVASEGTTTETSIPTSTDQAVYTLIQELEESSSRIESSSSIWAAPGVSVLEEWNRGRSWWQKLRSKLLGSKAYQKYNVEEFFTLIKKGKSKLTTEAAERYRQEIIKQIKQATSLGQTKLIKELSGQLDGLQKEIQIINETGLTTYVFEKDISELERIGINGRTVWRKTLENYTSIIPQECIDSIIAVKDKNLFDEIIVIYTRKHEKPLELDKKRKSKGSSEKVDPICFGRVNATGRLFFICDWMDDECDLTMSKLQKSVEVKQIIDKKKK